MPNSKPALLSPRPPFKKEREKEGGCDYSAAGASGIRIARKPGEAARGVLAAEAELREDGGGEGGADWLQGWRGGFGAGGVVAVVVMRGGAVAGAGGLGDETKRTPGPPPFSSMNSTPAASKAARIAAKRSGAERSRPPQAERHGVRSRPPQPRQALLPAHAKFRHGPSCTALGLKSASLALISAFVWTILF